MTDDGRYRFTCLHQGPLPPSPSPSPPTFPVDPRIPDGRLQFIRRKIVRDLFPPIQTVSQTYNQLIDLPEPVHDDELDQSYDWDEYPSLFLNLNYVDELDKKIDEEIDRKRKVDNEVTCTCKKQKIE